MSTTRRRSSRSVATDAAVAATPPANASRRSLQTSARATLADSDDGTRGAGAKRRRSPSSEQKRKKAAASATADDKQPSASKQSTASKKPTAAEAARLPPLAPSDLPPLELTAPPPTRDADTGEFVFEDEPTFRPRLSPEEVLRAGSFGGTYFRPIRSGVTGRRYTRTWEDLPAEWLAGLDIPRMVGSEVYSKSVNKYKVSCGQGLEAWEASGWIVAQDPYGWFQWYTRFFRGRRSDDDTRQIGRWSRCAGPTGRWRGNLVGKVYRAGAAYDDSGVSPVVRQTLLHWAYELNEADYLEGVEMIKARETRKNKEPKGWR
ncbi:hypothetical protein MMPV_002772 [Pyropia vietnamensis]